MAVYDYYDMQTPNMTTSTTAGSDFDKTDPNLSAYPKTQPAIKRSMVSLGLSSSSKWDQDKKADDGKLRMGLIPTSAYKALSAVLTHGAELYGDNTWQSVEPERYKDAILRHWTKFMDDPEGLDTDSGLPHIFHVLCNAMFLNHLILEKLQKDGKFLQLNEGKLKE